MAGNIKNEGIKALPKLEYSTSYRKAHAWIAPVAQNLDIVVR